MGDESPHNRTGLNTQRETQEISSENSILEADNPFHRHVTIDLWSNLKSVNLSNRMITSLPRAFGKLHLEILDLSQNNLNLDKCSWMEENAIASTLLTLNLSNNSLTELPYHITELNALKCLNVSHNQLERLPHKIGFFKRLYTFNLSFNKLLYLPASISFLTLLRHLDISENLLQSKKPEDFKLQPLSLVKLTADVVLNTHFRSLPEPSTDAKLFELLLKCVEEGEYCSICGLLRSNIKHSYSVHPLSDLIDCIGIYGVDDDDNVLIEWYLCPFDCEHRYI